VTVKNKFLSPDLVRRLGRIEMKARGIVEGFLSGLHKSPYRGFSVEFAEHRSYVPGDDVRHVDWKVYGKRERYYIKQYHEETNFAVTLLLDASESMTFSSDGPTKLEHAFLLATAMAYLVLRQNDAVAFGAYDRRAAAYLPPGTRLPFLAKLAEAFERVSATGGTDTGKSLSQLGRCMARKGIAVVLSDFLDSPAAILSGLRDLRSRGHEVIAVHVLDPAEITFPLKGHVRFEGMEKELRAFVEPQRLREAYLEALEAHLHALRQGATRSGVDYQLVSTADPPEEFLLGYLAARAKLRRVAR
jgi:uncharacterized protein (DUF58 family)